MARLPQPLTTRSALLADQASLSPIVPRQILRLAERLGLRAVIDEVRSARLLI
jgi:hypothetical protein